MTHLRLLLLLLPITACAIDESTTDEPPATDDEVFYQTVVTAHADGSFELGEPTPITAGEQRARNEIRLAGEKTSAIVQDSGCNGNSFWLFSRTDFTGNQICFRYAGFAWLPDYPRFITINGVPRYAGDWEIVTGSAWPGEQSGDIGTYGTPYEPGYTTRFAAWGPRFTFTGPRARDYVQLN